MSPRPTRLVPLLGLLTIPVVVKALRDRAVSKNRDRYRAVLEPSTDFDGSHRHDPSTNGADG